jgi:ribosomal protein S18 acetylase RimI-like enzyme
MPHESLQKFTVIDYSKQMVILAVIQREEKEECVGIGQYSILETGNTADFALVVRDDCHNQGIGTELLSYLTVLANRQGLFGFTAEVLVENKRMQHLFQKMGFPIERRIEEGVVEMRISFKKIRSEVRT